MQMISTDAYQARLNPWLNKHFHFAHCLPISFPSIRSAMGNEVFYFIVAAALFLSTWVGSVLLFSMLGLNGNSTVIDSLAFAFKKPEILILMLFAMIYLRAGMFILGKLRDTLSIATTSFFAIVLIPFLQEGVSAATLWIEGKPVTYAIPSQMTLIVWVVLAYVLTRSLVRQFDEAEKKNFAENS